jgi:transcriptional regulator with XRE-family HTH domain
MHSEQPIVRSETLDPTSDRKTRPAELGEFLRARRTLISPDDVGLRGDGLRRVPGLRREEVALLAGISSDYYLRLEQGRAGHPSQQVVDALARTLRLNPEAREYLHRLADLHGEPDPRWAEEVPEGIALLVDSWTLTPALVQGRRTDVLHSNHLAVALSPVYSVGQNLLRVSFADDRYHGLHQDWTEMAEQQVANLRVPGHGLDDPVLQDLIAELCAASERFRIIWARHDVKVRPQHVGTLLHPLVGSLQLRCERLPIPGCPGMSLVMYHADPGSVSEMSLRRLSDMTLDSEPVRFPRQGLPAKMGETPSDTSNGAPAL